MNKMVITGAIVLGLVLVGAGGYFLFGRSENGNQAASTTATPTANSEQSPESSAGLQSLSQLMAMSNIQQCSFTETVDSTQNSGDVYVGGGKMRGDFQTTAEGETTTAHVVVDGQTSYVWVDGQTTGYKSSLENIEGLTSEANEDINLEKPVDFSCRDWQVDASKFELPSGVEFIDVGSLIPGSGDTEGNDTQALQCAACDTLPAEAKEQCKSTLNCQ